MTPKPRFRAVLYSLHERVQLVMGRWRGGVKHHAASWVTREDAVDDHEMEVYVEVHARTESLHEVDCTALSVCNALAPRACAVGREDSVDEDALGR
jgi:hypothetical protein